MAWSAPKLNRRVTLRNPSSGAVTRDRYGGTVGAAVYSEQWEVWAARDDRLARESIEEAVAVGVARTEFTIRRRDRLDADVEVVDGDTVFRSVGPPLERGTRGGGSTHLVIVCEVRE